MNFTEESCPECGSENKVQLSRADEADAQGYFAVLYQCKDCGTAWDAYTR